jgi:hypothetical protein
MSDTTTRTRARELLAGIADTSVTVTLIGPGAEAHRVFQTESPRLMSTLCEELDAAERRAMEEGAGAVAMRYSLNQVCEAKTHSDAARVASCARVDTSAGRGIIRHIAEVEAERDRALTERDALLAEKRAPVEGREQLGMRVREVWIEWAKEQPAPKPSWLVPWEGLSEPDKEVDRRIGERLTWGLRAHVRVLTNDVDALNRTCTEAQEQLEADSPTRAENIPLRSRVASNPQTPRYMLQSLAFDSSASVRRSVAANPNTGPNLLQQMVMMPNQDIGVLPVLASNPNTPPDALQELINHSFASGKKR